MPRSDPPVPTASSVQAQLRRLADMRRAKNMAWFFKSGRGQYGEGDRFLGIRVPVQRRVAHQNRHLPLPEVVKLMDSPYHEDRFTALEILVAQYEAGDPATQARVFRAYVAHTDRINNWDLVDTSARYIVGAHLLHRSRKLIYRLARSTNLWERRIAVVSTHAWVARGDTVDAYAVARMLLDDPHDLIHKAVGWTLREAGRHSRATMLAFLKRHYTRVPRTALRYAIEHLPAAQRRRILAGNFDGC